MQTPATIPLDTSPTVTLAPPRQRSDLRPYANEKTLFVIMAIISAIGWVALTLGTLGTIWLIMLALYVLGLAMFSYFISYVRGNGVRVTAEQFPDLHARFEACCQTVGMAKRPEFYLITGNGALNAFATRFLHRYYVVLYSDVVDALEDDPDALNFYIGHELGHIAQRHLVHHWWLVFARWIPLLGTAYSRAREYTCDQYGLLCTHHSGSAVRALSVLAAGSRRWKTLNTHAYIAQTTQTQGFWMAVNELTADYPWLCKRVARVAHGVDTKLPRRSVFAWFLAALIPNTGFGLVGALIVYIYLSIILVPVGIVAYSGYAAKAKESAARIEHAPTREQLTKAYAVGMVATNLVEEYFNSDDHETVPESMDEIDFKNPDPQAVQAVTLDSDRGFIALQLAAPLNQQVMKLDLSVEKGALVWTCTVSGNLPKAAVPEECTSPGSEADENDDKVAVKPAQTLFEKMLEKVL